MADGVALYVIDGENVPFWMAEPHLPASSPATYVIVAGRRDDDWWWWQRRSVYREWVDHGRTKQAADMALALHTGIALAERTVSAVHLFTADQAFAEIAYQAQLRNIPVTHYTRLRTAFYGATAVWLSTPP